MRVLRYPQTVPTGDGAPVNFSRRLQLARWQLRRYQLTSKAEAAGIIGERRFGGDLRVRGVRARFVDDLVVYSVAVNGCRKGINV